MAALNPKQLIRRGQDFWQKRQRLIIILGLLAFLVAVFTPILSPDGIGIKGGDSVTTTIESTPLPLPGNTVSPSPGWNQIKKVEATKKESGKTVWDWLSLLGVPLTLAGLGYWLQTLGDFRQTTYQLNRTDKNIPFRQKRISF